MIHKTWWDFYDEDPYEKIGRYVPNAFGQDVIVELTRIAWTYLDWLEETEGSDIRQFFIDNDRVRLPSDGSIHTWMEGSVKTGFLRRERKGAPRPLWLAPAHPSEYVDI